MAQTKPTIVLVPGAWHTPFHYKLVTDRLQNSGYEVHSLHLPSTGSKAKPEPDTPDHNADVALIASTIRSAADAGKDVVVVVHSAGGVTASEGSIGLSKKEREAAGKAGGIVRMVYIAAFAAQEGSGVYRTTRGPSPWIDFYGLNSFPHDPVYQFYHDVEPALAQEAVENMGKHSIAAKWCNPTYAAWKHIPSTYLICETDRAIALPAQEAMIKAEGNMFTTVERCGASHSPMLSMPEFTAEVIRRAAGEDVKSNL